MANFNRQLLAKYSVVFGKKLEDNIPLLTSITKPTWAKMVARLNHLARTRHHYPPKDVFSEWFNRDNGELANEIWDQFVLGYKELGASIPNIKIINIWSNLTLLDLVLSTNYDAPNEMESSKLEGDILKLYLAINEDAADRSDKIFAQIPAKDFPNIVDRFARIGVTLLYPYHDLNHFEPIELFFSNFIKSIYCLKWLEASYPELLQKFLAPYGVKDWKEYLRGVLPIAHLAAVPNNDTGLNYLDITDSEDKEKAKKILDHLSLNQDTEYMQKNDFLWSRANPLYRVGEVSYLILDSLLTVNRIYNSMFFELLRISEKEKELKLAKGKFFAIYTFEFIEQYLSYTILDDIYSKTHYLKLSGQKIAADFALDTEPDYYVRNGNKVFLFEIKGSFVTGPTKQSVNFQDIEHELKEKFLFDTSDNGNKAVKQLAERIKILFEKSAKSAYDVNYNPKNIRIFPILIVSELMMTTPGMNHILNEWLLAEIESDETLKGSKNRIHQLTIIDIDTLIRFSREFRDDPSLLEKMLLEYEKVSNPTRVESIKKKFGVTEQELEERIWSTLDSFGFYIRRVLKPRIPEIFYEFAGDLFKESE